MITKIKCINGLDYHKVMFRNEITDLVRHAIKSKVDYIISIDFNSEGAFIVSYMSYGREMCYSDKYNIVAKRIREFVKIEQREDKLKELGIWD